MFGLQPQDLLIILIVALGFTQRCLGLGTSARV